MAFQQLAHPDGEVASAKAAEQLGIPFVISSWSNKSIEEVGEATTDKAINFL